MTPEVGWYWDPLEEADFRWWDGVQWTDRLHIIDTADEIEQPPPFHEPVAQHQPPPTPPPPPPPPRIDLALNRPAQGILALDEFERGLRPKRSWFQRWFGPAPQRTSWEIGSVGEIATASALRALGPGWLALHSVPVGKQGADIDHIVIGPPGVFTINSKNHQTHRVCVNHRSITVGGHNKDYLTKSRIEAERAERRLKKAYGQRVSVLPLIVVYASMIEIESQPIDVDIIPGNELTAWLLRQRPIVSPAEVEQLFEVARWSDVWV